MNVADFAISHGQDPKTVRAYLRRHKEEFEPIIERKVNEVILSDEAYILLEDIYPPPKPIIYEDKPQTLEELEALKAENKELKEKYLQILERREASEDNTKALLTDYNHMQGKFELLEEQSKAKEEKLQELTERNAKQAAELQSMKHEEAKKAAEQEKTLKELAIERATNQESQHELKEQSKVLEAKLQELEEARQIIKELQENKSKKKSFFDLFKGGKA